MAFLPSFVYLKSIIVPRVCMANHHTHPLHINSSFDDDRFMLGLFQPTFHIDSGATAIAGSGNSLTITMIRNIASRKDARNICHRILNRHDVADFIHSNNALKQSRIWLVTDSQKESLSLQLCLLTSTYVAYMYTCYRFIAQDINDLALH